MPSSKKRLSQSLCRIEPNKMQIPPNLKEKLLCHSLLCKMPILGEVLSEVAAIQYLCQQQLPSLLIPRRFHLTQLARPLWSVILMAPRFQVPKGRKDY